MKPKLPKILRNLQSSSPSSSLSAGKATGKHAKLVQQVWNWIVHDLSAPSPDYNDMPPCPYARHALLHGQVIFHTTDDIQAAVEIKAISNDPDLFTHVLIITDISKKLTPDAMMDFIDEQNKNHFGTWMIGMHPDSEDAELSVWQALNMDDWGILLVQSLYHLDNAFGVLLDTPYYRGLEDFKDLVDRKVAVNAWNEKKSKEVFREESILHEDETETEEEVRH
tara:strand:- start:2641 stop:3309 length:669 start_codon:yes stop_codon:yes gene_type:complete